MSLETLLDASNLSSVSDYNMNINNLVNTSNESASIIENPFMKSTNEHVNVLEYLEFPPTNENLVSSHVKEACLELLYILIQQDVHNICTFPLKKMYNTNLCLRNLKREIMCNKIPNLTVFQAACTTILTPDSKLCSPDSLQFSELKRLLGIASQWFRSITDPSLWITNNPNSIDISTLPGISLNILNPDNRGFVNSMDRVRTIGEEVGHLQTGTHLLQYGGYREDRRNKIVPYTYLNYGPFSSFGPSFDSGASNCTPEANQLLLGTSWKPAELRYLIDEESLLYDDCDNQCATSPWSNMSVIANELDSSEILAVINECEEEWQAAKKSAEELDAIIPYVSSENDFYLYLANAITNNLPKTDENQNSEESEMDKVDSLTLNNPLEPESDQNLQNSNTVLQNSSRTLRQLYNAQYRRLGKFDPNDEDSCLRPNANETQTAHNLVNQLVSLCHSVKPSDIVSRQTIRKQLGIEELGGLINISPVANIRMDAMLI